MKRATAEQRSEGAEIRDCVLDQGIALRHPAEPYPAPPKRGGRARNHPNPSAVVEAQAELLAHIELDAEFAWHTCWACRLDMKGAPQLAHIVAVRDGGSDAPDNFILLCPSCHFEQPDDSPREVQELWLRLHISFDELVVARVRAALERGTEAEVERLYAAMARRRRKWRT